MNRKFAFSIMLALLTAFLIIGAAAAQGDATTKPVCYGDCPKNQVFTDTQTLYASDYVTYSEWGAWSDWGRYNYCHGDSDLCQDEKSAAKVSGNWHYRHQHRTVVNEHACPAGYTYHEVYGSNDCYKDETFSVTFDYGKSADPHKCHRPTGASLGVPSWAMSQFNHDFDEWVDAPSGDQYCPAVDCQVSAWSEWSVCEAGSQSRTRTITVPPAYGGLVCPALTETQSCQSPVDVCTNLDGLQETIPDGYEDPDQDGVCTIIVVPVYGCTDPEAVNYNPEATVDDQSCEYEAEDVCPNIEGDQATIPDGMVKDEQGNCVTPYHPPYVPTCDSSKRIWVWTLTDANGIAYTLRDLGYDGTYDSPGVDQQCFYFGCEFKAVKATGRWVNECDSAYDYWRELPRFAGGGQCPLPGAPSQ